MMALLPLIGIAAIAAAIWYGVKKARSAPAPAVTEPPSPQAQALKKMGHIAYGLYAAAAIFPVTAIAGLILVYLKQGEAKGTWLAGHFRWLIRTFWFMWLWIAIGFATFFVCFAGFGGSAIGQYGLNRRVKRFPRALNRHRICRSECMGTKPAARAEPSSSSTRRGCRRSVRSPAPGPSAGTRR